MNMPLSGSYTFFNYFIYLFNLKLNLGRICISYLFTRFYLIYYEAISLKIFDSDFSVYIVISKYAEVSKYTEVNLMTLQKN